MDKNQYIDKIAYKSSLPQQSIEQTLLLLDEGCTIPFIARYRKERTGNLNEVQIADIRDLYISLQELVKRKEYILKSIEEQGKLSPELKRHIEECMDFNTLEDLYLPYKPKRHTKAQIAKEAGLEPLAEMIMLGQFSNRLSAQRFINDKIKSIDDAILGAQAIISETVNENEQVRQSVRSLYKYSAIITSKVVPKIKEEEKAQKYSNYFDFSEPLNRCSSHRLLAMRRGEREGILHITIKVDDDECINRIERQYRNSPMWNTHSAMPIIKDAFKDSYKRLIKPSMETEFAASSKENADIEAIRVFSENLRQLLLAAPLGEKKVMGVDPGIRTGCKVVCLDAQGNLLYHEIVQIARQPETAARQLIRLVKDYKIEAIAIGNGTYSRESSDFIHSLQFDHEVQIFVVSEDGASIYSASEVAREEFPNEDITVRGAVSIGRRLMDPLAELVKIDPKSIGVGQYQHDVDEKLLK